VGKSRIEADMDNKRKEEKKMVQTREPLAHVERERRDPPDRQWLLPRVL